MEDVEKLLSKECGQHTNVELSGRRKSDWRKKKKSTEKRGKFKKKNQH